MGETVEYGITGEGFQNDAEQDEFIGLCRKFDGDGELSEDDREHKRVSYLVAGGWRGGGSACEELLEDAFKEWLEAHPHVRTRFECRYIEHAPVETIVVEQGDWKNYGVDCW